MHETNTLQIKTLAFFRKVVKLPISDRKKFIQQFYHDLQALEQDIFEQRSMLYLDIIKWLGRKV
jgi:hypothetical protein